VKICFHSTPQGFYKKDPPYNKHDLFKLVKKAYSMGFRCFQIGPFRKDRFSRIDGKQLKRELDEYGMERNVHVGGLYQIEKFADYVLEYKRLQNELKYGVKLCNEINSSLMSLHPPYTFKTLDKKIIKKAKTKFLLLVKKEVESASRQGIKFALESYHDKPFIFNGLSDFHQFVSQFPPTKLGVLLDTGHMYTMQKEILKKQF
jgi:sugar phosphate isomerase/epimerase